MQIALTGKNFDVPEDIRAYAETKLGKLMRLYKRIERTSLTLTEKASKTKSKANKVEIILHIPGDDLRSEEAGESFRAAIDVAVEKLAQQLKKAKGRLIDKQQQQHQSIEAVAARATSRRSSAKSATPAVHDGTPLVYVEKFSLKPMSTRDAIVQLNGAKGGKRGFYLFFNAAGNINCIYKRDDGHFGLIVPETEISE